MILETRVKGRFVIGHVRTLHYWGLDSDDIGVPTMLRPNAASRGNTWVFKKYEGALPNQYSATTDPLLRHLDIMNRKRPKPPTILRNEENDVGEGARSVVVTPQEDSPSVIWDNPNDGDPQFLIPNCGVFIPAMTYFKYLEANDDDKLDCNWKREYPTLVSFTGTHPAHCIIFSPQMAARIQAYPYLRRRDGLGDIGLPTDPGSGLNIPIAEIDPCAVQGACNVVQRYPMTEKLTETFIGAVNLLCLFIYVAGYIMRHGWMI
ncbi:hypothetical protein BD410DRAFT_549032 [Rickenella mellea]|uniref:Uncharacterized protein n=1 Tax=Rickenella mellea TaxID=50990 RepID=A0A4Y7PQ20_9AGAM|nr:hypothetical protein BD410DRAFT_549032 [Rickenella mellea]